MDYAYLWHTLKLPLPLQLTKRHMRFGELLDFFWQVFKYTCLFLLILCFLPVVPVVLLIGTTFLGPIGGINKRNIKL